MHPNYPVLLPSILNSPHLSFFINSYFYLSRMHLNYPLISPYTSAIKLNSPQLPSYINHRHLGKSFSTFFFKNCKRKNEHLRFFWLSIQCKHYYYCCILCFVCAGCAVLLCGAEKSSMDGV